MAARSEAARLVAELTLQDKMSPGLKKASGSLTRFEGGLKRVGGGLRNAGRVAGIAGAGVAVGVAAFAKSGIESLAELEDATTAVAGALENAGIAGQVTADQIATWANEIERDVGAAFDDKDIVSATGTLVRFGKVTPGNIRPAMEVITDLATKTGDVDSAATLLAKALADPTKAAGKLARSGVVLTKAQQKTITAMVEANDVAGAQALILEEVEKTTKGAADASQGPYRRSLSVLADVTEDAQRALGEGFLPVIEKVSDLLGTELAKKSTIDNIRNFGKGLAAGLDNLIDIARGLPWAAIGDSLKVAGTGAKAVLDAFTGLPPWVQTAVITGWGLNKVSGGLLSDVFTGLASGLIKGVLGMTAGVVNINAAVVNGAGGLPGAAGAAGKGGGLGAVGALGLGGLIIAAAVPIGEAFAAALPKELKGQGGQGMSESQTRILNAQKETKEKVIALGVTFGRSQGKTTSATDRVKAAQQETKRETSRGLNSAKAQTERSGNTVANQTRASSNGIVSAIRANRPVTTVNVSVSSTNVTTVNTKVGRSGPTSGSRNRDSADSNVGPK